MENSIIEVLKLSHCKLQSPARGQLSQTKGSWFESSGKKIAMLREMLFAICIVWVD